MNALSRIRQAGFDVAIDGDGFTVTHASALTPNQREFLKEHKAEIMTELKALYVTCYTPNGKPIEVQATSTRNTRNGLNNEPKATGKHHDRCTHKRQVNQRHQARNQRNRNTIHTVSFIRAMWRTPDIVVSGVAFGEVAERIAKLQKGDSLAVIGSLKPTEWQDKNTGETKRGLNITASNALSVYDIKKRMSENDNCS